MLVAESDRLAATVPPADLRALGLASAGRGPRGLYFAAQAAAVGAALVERASSAARRIDYSETTGDLIQRDAARAAHLARVALGELAAAIGKGMTFQRLG
jgi:hypothetical protein